MIKMSNINQEPPASLKALNHDLKDMDVLCIFKIKIGSQNLEHGSINDQWPYPNQDQDAKPQSGPPSILQTPKSEHKGHECSLQFSNQINWNMGVSRLVTKSELRSRSQTPVRNLKQPSKPKSVLNPLMTQIKIDLLFTRGRGNLPSQLFYHVSGQNSPIPKIWVELTCHHF